MSTSTSNSNATPARDRLPFPPSAQRSPSNKRLVSPSSSSASLPANGVAIPTQVVTVDSLLSTHADASSPPMAALNQIVSERNAFAAQNAQLWRLVEKQRSGYNQILKELERVRSERDVYKNRSNALGNPDKEKKRDGEKQRRSSNSLPPSDASNSMSSSRGEPSNSRASQRQMQSRSSQDSHISASRKAPPPSPSTLANPTTSKTTVFPTNISIPDTAPLGQTSSSVPVIIVPVPPLSFPPRSESLPIMATTISSSPEQAQYKVNDTLPGHRNGTSQSRQLNPSFPRKANVPEEGPSLNASTTITRNEASSRPVMSDSHHVSPQARMFGIQSQSSALGSSQNVNMVNENVSLHVQPETGNLHSSSTNLSIPTSHSREDSDAYHHSLSRDSRISLPDEAKQYIANMQQSPIPTPELDNQAIPHNQVHDQMQDYEATPTKQPSMPTHNQHKQHPQSLSHTQSHVFTETPMQGNAHPTRAKSPSSDFSPRPAKASAPTNVEMIQLLREGPSSFPAKSNRDETARTRQDHEEFLDLDDDDGEVEDDAEDEDAFPRSGKTSNPRQRAAVEDFPLPPSNAPGHGLSQVQAQALATNKDWLLTGNSTIQLSGDALNSSYNPSDPPSIASSSSRPLPASFRALPLLASDLPYTQIKVSHSSIRPNDKGKDVSSFIVELDPGNGKEGWKVEKLFSDVLALDARVRASVGKGVGKKIASLPEGKLWRDHAPAKVDQRKAALETYLQTLINLPVKNKDEIIAFFTSDIVREAQKPVSQVGYKEGYLTKRGKNFGGWKTRFFVLQGPVLEYYESRGGTHLGSISITGAQIGRQQKTADKPSGDEEKEYRHAFLIVEAKKGPGGSHPRHVLCAESDSDRDDWVEMLVRYVLGSYNEEPVLSFGHGPISTNDHPGSSTSRSSTSSNSPFDNNMLNAGNTRRTTARGVPRDEMSRFQLSTGATVNGTSPTRLVEELSPVKSAVPSPIDQQGTGAISDAYPVLQGQAGVPDSFPLSSSLPSTSPLDDANRPLAGIGRPSSELGQYSDAAGHGRNNRDYSPEQRRQDHHGDTPSFLDTVAAVPRVSIQSADYRAASPEKVEANAKAKISGPIGGAPIPPGYKFGSKDPSLDPAGSSMTAYDRREKAKSRSFWGFGRPNGAEKSQPTFTNRSVFGVALEDSLEVAQIASLPAVVFRCIQYLESKKADHEEGIYRLSGSSAVIKNLKDRFNSDGDVDLLASDEYWDPHAIAGLLKSFLRELPASILTRDLHLRFLSVIDFVDAQERIKELSQLIAALPIANYSLLRALTAHLILIVQNAYINKMTMRNVGIVFSPTLGIPAGVFSLMLAEFNRVFNVDAANNELVLEDGSGQDQQSDLSRRNSRQYSDAAADQLLGLSGRFLPAPAEEPQSDGDDFSVDESGTETTEGEGTVDSSGRSSPGDGQSDRYLSPDTPTAPRSKASHVAATRGLNIDISERGNRHSRIVGLPSSPRPFPMPTSPLHTPK